MIIETHNTSQFYKFFKLQALLHRIFDTKYHYKYIIHKHATKYIRKTCKSNITDHFKRIMRLHETLHV